MPKIIRTDELGIGDVPDDKADWHEISLFALSFDPMLELGTTDIYKITFTKFDEGSSLQELRTSLFLLQRAWNNRSKDIDEDGLETLRKLISLIKKKLMHQANVD